MLTIKVKDIFSTIKQCNFIEILTGRVTMDAYVGVNIIPKCVDRVGVMYITEGAFLFG